MENQSGLRKRPTGIEGLDAATGGGLPAAGMTLVMGSAGAGKTVLGMQILAAALARGEGGLLVSFEEAPEQLRRNMRSFHWGPQLDDGRVEIIDARPNVDAEVTGRFDIVGLIALLDARALDLKVGWVVVDGIDQLLRRQPDEASAVNEIQRLDDWSRRRELSVVLTAKHDDVTDTAVAFLSGIEYILSTVIVLSAELVGRRLNRRLRIAKYRGTAHVTDELPVVIDAEGLHLPSAGAFATVDGTQVSGERHSCGVPQLDEHLGGGYYQGSSVLISGPPGTSKTTLGGAFMAAAAGRGERALMISFDEPESQIVRNLRSVGLDLQPHIDSGCLRLLSRSPWSALVEGHFIAIFEAIEQFSPHCLVIDPVSGLLKAASGESPFAMVERLLNLAKWRGITTLMTSLTEREQLGAETTMSHISTVADTWISLDYRPSGGERNRTLSIVKSRGSAHSSQVHELLLSGDGVRLATVFEYGSEVLMGTARLQKEHEIAQEAQREALERAQHRGELERRLDHVEAQLAGAGREKQRIQREMDLERQMDAAFDDSVDRQRDDIRRSRAVHAPGGRSGGKAHEG